MCLRSIYLLKLQFRHQFFDQSFLICVFVEVGISNAFCFGYITESISQMLCSFCRLMVSAFINVCLISETFLAVWETKRKPEEILIYKVSCSNYMNNTIAGSFG